MKSALKIPFVLLLFVLLPAIFASARNQPLQFVTLHAFAGPPDGSFPQAGLLRDAQGALYGTSYEGGLADCAFGPGCGTVFKLDSHDKESILYAFPNFSQGADPQATLIRDAHGDLYGTTQFGGSSECYQGYGCGTIFEVTAAGKETVLHSFVGEADGKLPAAGLIADSNGDIYGTTEFGGSGEFGYGVVFKLDVHNNKETILYRFCSEQNCADGEYPEAALIRDTRGNLYGTTVGGANYGVVFKLDPSGKETVLHTFTGGADGANPYSNLIRDSQGNFYGTTQYGGNLSGCAGEGCGVVFELDTIGNETVLYAFTGGTDGSNPRAGLIRDAEGSLYGTTQYGGNSNSCEGGCGVVFKLDSSGNETVLHAFCSEVNCTDGSSPLAGLISDGKGNGYGTTSFAGDPNCYCGTVFKITQ